MTVPPAITGCPPGLEYLTTLDCLFVEEQVDIVDLFIGFEQNNKYVLKNRLGEKVCSFFFQFELMLNKNEITHKSTNKKSNRNHQKNSYY